MVKVTRVQIMDEAVCIQGMNLIISSLAMAK